MRIVEERNTRLRKFLYQISFNREKHSKKYIVQWQWMRNKVTFIEEIYFLMRTFEEKGQLSLRNLYFES